MDTLDANFTDEEAAAAGGGECQALKPLEGAAAKAAVAAAHAATLAGVAAMAKAIYDQVDGQHPVFAVVLQELPVVLAGELALCAILGMELLHQHREEHLMLMGVVSTLVMQFHQLSWLCITLLRYYLLVATPPSADIDMSSLRRRSVRAVWKAAGPFVALCQLPWLCIFSWHGWPRVHMSQLEPGVLLLVTACTMAVSNAPDFVSIGVYVRMVRHFHVKSGPPPPSLPPAHQPSPEDWADFGGIWVGEESEGDADSIDFRINQILHGSPPPPPSEKQQQTPPPQQPRQEQQLQQPQQRQKHQKQQKQEQTEQQQHQQYQNQQHSADRHDPQHSAVAVMRVLRWHILSCLSDAAMAGASALACTGAGQALFHSATLASGVWIPAFLIANSFRRLRLASRLCPCLARPSSEEEGEEDQ